MGVNQKPSRSKPDSLLHTPRDTSILHIPLSCILWDLYKVMLVGFVAKTAHCYIPYEAAYIKRVGPGPCYKPIVWHAAIWQLSRDPFSGQETFYGNMVPRGYNLLIRNFKTRSGSLKTP